MTTTISILNANCTLPMAGVNTAALDVSKFALIDQVVSPDGNTREAIYQMTEGDVEYPLSLRVGFYKNPKANGGMGQTNISVKLTTNVQKADVDDVIWTAPFTITLATSAPGSSPLPDQDNLMALLSAVMTTFVPYEAGDPSASLFDNMKFGIVNRLLQYANTAS